MSTASVTRRRPLGHEGPPLLVPALAFVGLTIAAAVLGASGPRPGTDPGAVLEYAATHRTALRVGAALMLGSALPLLVFAATAWARLRRLGITAPGPLMGLAGATLAGASLAGAALAGWTLAQSAQLGDAHVARVLAWEWFAAGGVGFVAPFGLLIAGLAVPALLGRLLPRPVAWAGLGVAIIAMASTFAAATSALYPLLPVGRFGGCAFLLVVAVGLPAGVGAGQRMGKYSRTRMP